MISRDFWPLHRCFRESCPRVCRRHSFLYYGWVHLPKACRFSSCGQPYNAFSGSVMILMLPLDTYANPIAKNMASTSTSFFSTGGHLVRDCRSSQLRQLLLGTFEHPGVGVHCVLMILRLPSQEFDPAILLVLM